MILKSDYYNSKEESTKLHHAENEKKKKKKDRKLTILRMIIVLGWRGGKWAKHTHSKEKKNAIGGLFLFKK